MIESVQGDTKQMKCEKCGVLESDEEEIIGLTYKPFLSNYPESIEGYYCEDCCGIRTKEFNEMDFAELVGMYPNMDIKKPEDMESYPNRELQKLAFICVVCSTGDTKCF